MTAAKPKPYSNRKTASICLITGNASLAASLRTRLGGHTQMRVKSSLAEMFDGADDDAFILDGRVRDMALWPAPLLANDAIRLKPWAILLSQTTHDGLEMTPPHSAVFPHNAAGLRDASDYLSDTIDVHARRRIEKVVHIEDERSFLIHMGDHRSFLLRLADLPESDDSRVTRCSLSTDHEYFTVQLESGTRIEIPWDAVLYHCDPTYEYYNGKSSDDESAVRIGRRVRQERLARNLTITELARLSGMQRPNLSRLEHGRQVPSLETLERVAEALGTRVVELIAE